LDRDSAPAGASDGNCRSWSTTASDTRASLRVRFLVEKRRRQAVEVAGQQVLAAAEIGDATDRNYSRFVPF
jgi:hypothetical protein